MARSPRIKSNTKVYHVIIRGINKQDIFLDNQDYRKFIKEVKRVKEKYKFEIFAYALMRNHVHLVLYDKNNNISITMQSLNISYSNYFNKKYERVGHLFDNRFKSHVINDEEYLKNVIRYVHKNPENAGLKPYIWTSYYEYVNNNMQLINPKMVMKVFANNIENFKLFHIKYNKSQDYDKNFEMVKKIQDDDAIEMIKDLINEDNLMKIQNYDKEKKREVLKKILEIQEITKKQISRILGISLSTIDRLKK